METLLVLILKIDLVPLTNFDLLDILDLLESLLIALIADLEILIPLITAAINKRLKKYINSEEEEIEWGVIHWYKMQPFIALAEC